MMRVHSLVSRPFAALGVLHHKDDDGLPAYGKEGLETSARFLCASGMQSNVKLRDR